MQQKDIEEVWRRQIVAISRQAGTNIRIEEIKRQALSASINLSGAMEVQKSLLEAVRKTTPANIKNPETPTSDDIGNYYGNYILKALLSIPDLPISKLQKIFSSLNTYVQVCNHIISDLVQEKVYIASIPEVSIPGDYFSAILGLTEALDTANRVVGTFRGLIEASEIK